MVFSANRAEVAELVDAHDSGACGATCVSSNLSFRTKSKERPNQGALFFVNISAPLGHDLTRVSSVFQIFLSSEQELTRR